MKEGETKLIKKICISKKCENCGERATKQITFLIEGNARKNPASSAYGKDDCRWRSDAKGFSCEGCVETMKNNPPRNMSWCATFSREKFEHMFLEWKEEEVKEMLASDFNRQFAQEIGKGR